MFHKTNRSFQINIKTFDWALSKEMDSMLVYLLFELNNYSQSSWHCQTTTGADELSCEAFFSNSIDLFSNTLFWNFSTLEIVEKSNVKKFHLTISFFCKTMFNERHSKYQKLMTYHWQQKLCNLKAFVLLLRGMSLHRNVVWTNKKLWNSWKSSKTL